LRNVVEDLFHDKDPRHLPHRRAGQTGPPPRPRHGRDRRRQDRAAGRPDLIVVVDEQTLRTGLHEHSIIDLGIDTVLPVETLRRMACCANIIPAVLGTDGVLRDLGRGARLASREQRRALRAMYPTCGIPGCRVGFEQCVIHHIRYWENHGRTT
jgi:hypothetical protein